MRLIKEETILRKFEGIKNLADSDTSLSRTDRECLKEMLDRFCEIVQRLPEAEDEDPNIQVCVWHDLRKDPDDLPNDDILCWGHVAGTDVEREVYHEAGVWLNSSDGIQVDVIAWTDMPAFQMEKEGSGLSELYLSVVKGINSSFDYACRVINGAMEQLGKAEKC